MDKSAKLRMVAGSIIAITVLFVVIASTTEPEQPKESPALTMEKWSEGKAIAACSDLLKDKLSGSPNAYLFTKSDATKLDNGTWAINVKFDGEEQLMNAHCEIYTSENIALTGIYPAG